MAAGLISDDFARRLNSVLLWAERKMRARDNAGNKLDYRPPAFPQVHWGRLLEDVGPGDLDKRFLRYMQNSEDGSWDEGLLDNGAPEDDDYEQNDVFYVDDNLLETGELLTTDTWCVIALNLSSGRWQIINWQGCVS